MDMPRITGAIKAAFTGALLGIGLGSLSIAIGMGLYNDDDQGLYIIIPCRAIQCQVNVLSDYIWYAPVFVSSRGCKRQWRVHFFGCSIPAYTVV